MSFRNVKVESVSSPKAIGDLCLISCSYEYQGSATNEDLYVAIGNSGFFGFDEIIADSINRSIPACSTWTKLWGSILITITDAIDPNDSPYDVYCKIGGVVSDPVKDVLVITGTAPPEEEFTDLVVTGYTNPVTIGGYCQVSVSFKYQGPAQTRELYAAIGNSGTFGFDEILHGTATLSLPLTNSLTTMTAVVFISISSDIDPNDSPYDLYAKIDGAFPEITSPTYSNIISVTGGEPEEEFTNISITSYNSPVDIGDYCDIHVEFYYQGPAQTKMVYAAIGNGGAFGFDEILNSSVSVTLPRSTSPQKINGRVRVLVTSDIDPDQSPYDIYAKIVGGIISPTVYNVITVVGEPEPPSAEFRNLAISDYLSPVGPGDTCVIQVSFEYQGPAMTKELYAAIGNSGSFGFDEILNGSANMSVPVTLSWQSYVREVPITVTADLSESDSPYDLYAKIDGVFPDIEAPILKDVLVVKASAGEPEFKNFVISDYTSPVSVGGLCRITVSMEYQGPAVSKQLYVAIGNGGAFGFDEILNNQKTISIPATDAWVTRTETLTIAISSALSPSDAPYDLYAKLDGILPDIEAPILYNVIGMEGGGPGVGDIVGTITKIEPTYFEPGTEINLKVSYAAYTDDADIQAGWQTRVVIDINGFHGEQVMDHTGPEAEVEELSIVLGTMPETTITGTLKLEGRPLDEDWSTLESGQISIGSGSEAPEEGGFGSVGWILLAIAAAVAVTGSTEKKPATKKKEAVKS